MSRPHYTLLTPPAAEPISYDEAAEHLRVDSADDAAYIEGLIAVAREYVEGVTGRVSMESTWRVVAPTFDSFEQPTTHHIYRQGIYSYLLGRTPLVSVASVKYYAPDSSDLTTMSAEDYRVITSVEPGILQVIGGSLPSLEDRMDAVQIEFTAGHSSSDLVPATLRHAMKLLVAHLYEERKPVAFASCQEIPHTLRTLIEANRVSGWFA